MSQSPVQARPEVSTILSPSWQGKYVADDPVFNNSWLLQFTKRLQSTLQIDQLFEVFSEQIRRILDFDSLKFDNKDLGIHLEQGRHGVHSCNYEITLSDSSLGMMTFTRKYRFLERELNRIEGLISHLMYPLRNALLYSEALQAASRDPLTGIQNRAALENTLAREVQLSQRHDTPLALLMLDLDHFKNVNDTYGHITGDCVLKEFVSAVETEIRASDMLFRYGGEEFSVILTNTDQGGAYLLAERIRQAVENLHINCDSIPLRVTTSIGVGILDGEDDATSLMQRADMSLYKAKNTGRNRVGY